MIRISTNMNNDSMQYYLKRRDFKTADLQSKMATGRKINNLSDDPLAAAHLTRVKSGITRMEQYQKNASMLEGRYNQAEGQLSNAFELLHRLKELAVQASNGILDADQRGAIAYEVDELLNELVNISNAKGENDIPLFAGSDTSDSPFIASKGKKPGFNHEVITSIDYFGSIQKNQVEIDNNSTIDANFVGNDIFWAEKQQIFGANNAAEYIVSEDGKINIDGVEIPLAAGDNIESVIFKINESAASVEASLDPVTNSLIISGSSPHQIWMDEAEGTTMLKDIGILSPVKTRPPANINRDAIVGGGSIFQMAIDFRDTLITNNYSNIATRTLGTLDTALDSMLKSVTDIGSKTNRLQVTAARMEKATLDFTEFESNIGDIDMTKASLDLAIYNHTQKAAYQVAGKILQPTLLDYLR